MSACCFCLCVAPLACFRAPGSWLNPKKRGEQEARRLHHLNKIRRMSHHETFFTEKKGRSVRLSPTPKFRRVIWVVQGAGGGDQPKIWPYSHPALRHPKAPLFATSAKRSPNALRARGQVERERGQEPSHRGPRPAPAPRSRPRKVLTQEDRRGVSTTSAANEKNGRHGHKKGTGPGGTLRS